MPLLQNLSTGEGIIRVYFCVMDLGGTGRYIKLYVIFEKCCLGWKNYGCNKITLFTPSISQIYIHLYTLQSSS